MDIRCSAYQDPDALPGLREKRSRAPGILWEEDALLAAALKKQKLDHNSGHLRTKPPCATHA